ncbi:MAG: hypothetical protein HYX41_05185 [Bdellovibrio sp.]|nr:hypothetical protein [Bdellovibrio sp.]
MAFLITGVEFNSSKDSGQSVLEFLFSLPLLLGLSALLIRMNTVIQMGIVNQQYARAQALYVAFNSPWFPEMDRKIQMVTKRQNAFLVGISAEPAPDDASDYAPSAPQYNVARGRKHAGMGSDANREEPTNRAKVRVRSTVTLCAESQFVGAGGSLKPMLSHSPTPPYRPIGNSNLVQGVTLNNYCWSGLTYEQ